MDKITVIKKDEPNIAFIGEKIGREPITKFNDGMKLVTMPPVEEQLKPFFHKEAPRIVRLWPKLYKSYVAKGG